MNQKHTERELLQKKLSSNEKELEQLQILVFMGSGTNATWILMDNCTYPGK